MPELPEVESVVRSLRKFVVGEKIAEVELRREKSLPQGEKYVRQKSRNCIIIAVERRAKYIDLILQPERDSQNLPEKLHLLTHLKMTGQLIFVGGDEKKLAGGGHPTADWRAQLPGPHTRIIYTFDDGAHLYFNDQRVFGWMKIVDTKELAEIYACLGPDANTNDWSAKYLKEKLAKKRIPIKQALLDNKILCGLGNIYVAEALWAARIDPRRPAQSLSLTELEEIEHKVRAVLDRAIAAGGTTFDGRYVDARGERGNFTEQLQVYGRNEQTCHRCGQTLAAIRQGGRQTIFCPHCQK